MKSFKTRTFSRVTSDEESLISRTRFHKTCIFTVEKYRTKRCGESTVPKNVTRVTFNCRQSRLVACRPQILAFSIDLTSKNSMIPSCPHSRPFPEVLNPPNGTAGSIGAPFKWSMPARIFFPILAALSASLA